MPESLYPNAFSSSSSFYEDGHTLKIRFVKIELPTGEVEILMTHLGEEDFRKKTLPWFIS